MTLFPPMLRKEYFDCPERLFRSTLHLTEGGEGSLYPRTVLSWLFQSGSISAVYNADFPFEMSAGITAVD
jgi:hypothetical protein